jgi:DNA-binding NarL/FixJ family response regulator
MSAAIGCTSTQNLEVCGEAIDGADLLKKANEREPALIILDLRMPYMNDVELTSALRRRLPNVRIILLTMYDEVAGHESLMSVDAIILKMRCFDRLGSMRQRLAQSTIRRSRSLIPNQRSQLRAIVQQFHPMRGSDGSASMKKDNREKR